MQKLIGDGNFVKSVAKSGNKLVVTMSKGAPVEIELGEAAKGGNVVEIAANGEITIDGKGTGFFASKTKAPYVNAEGELITFNEKGEEVKTGIMKVVAVKNANGSYTLSVPGADGKMMDIVLPSAASGIQSITVKLKSSTPDDEELTFVSTYFRECPSKWKGPKTLPATGTYFALASDEYYHVAIMPASVDATKLPFTAVNSKMEAVKGLTFKVEADSENVMTKATNALYKVTPNPVAFANVGAKDEFFAQFNNGNPIAYALSIGANDFVSNFDLAFKNAADPFTNASAPTLGGEASQLKAELNKEYSVKFTQESSLYDMYMEVTDKNKASLFGVVIDNAKRTLKVTKAPSAEGAATDKQFDVKITYISYSGGTPSTATVTVKLGDKIDVTNPSFAAVTHSVATEGNAFCVSLADMKTALGDKLPTWLSKLDRSATEVTFYADEACNTVVKANPSGIDLKHVEKVTENSDVAVDKINFLKFAITNGTASQQGLKLDTQYYAKVTFNSAAGELNSIVIPVKFTAPATSTFFAVAPGYEKDGVICAPFDVTLENDGYISVDGTRVSDLPVFFLKNAFTKSTPALGTSLKVYVDEEQMIGEVKANTLFWTNRENGDTNKTFAQTWICPTSAFGKKAPEGYGEAVTVQVEQADYEGWAYQNEEDKKYSFKIKLFSPIYDGSVKALKALEVNAGSTIYVGEKDIMAYDYNNNPYSIIPTTVTSAESYTGWSTSFIEKLTVSAKDASVLTTVEFKSNCIAAPTAADPSHKVNGIQVTAAGLGGSSVDTAIKVVIEDIWGFKNTTEIPVKVKVGSAE